MQNNKKNRIQKAKNTRNRLKKLLNSGQITIQPGIETPNKTFVRTLLNIHYVNVDNTMKSIKNMNINNQNRKLGKLSTSRNLVVILRKNRCVSVSLHLPFR